MSIGGFADWLGRHFPLAYRVTRPPWRLVRRVLSRPSYWDKRRDFNYYREVIRLAKAYVPSGGQVVDVGAHETEVLRQLDWFQRRVALDVRYIPPHAGIETIVTDFLDYQPESGFDLALCLQVLEHVGEPATFARKLLETGRTVIISVPYRWPREEHKGHLHDPIDEAKLELWTQRKPVTTTIIADRKKERLIAVYQR
jgi:hypothetical protein